MTADQRALLRAVSELQGDGDDWPTTLTVGARLREIYEQRGGPYSWVAQSPWHGTYPMAIELCEMGLLDYDVGLASINTPGSPTPSATTYALGITDKGRVALAADGPGPA